MGKGTTDMSGVTTVGLDLAKHIFRVHAADAAGNTIVTKSLRRKDLLASSRTCLAAAWLDWKLVSSAYHWARELIKLGHQVRLIPPAYVKAFVRRQKNDAADAAAICEEVTRPSMRFVPVPAEPS